MYSYMCIQNNRNASGYSIVVVITVIIHQNTKHMQQTDKIYVIYMSSTDLLKQDC